VTSLRWIVGLLAIAALVSLLVLCTRRSETNPRPVAPTVDLTHVYADSHSDEIVAPASQAERSTDPEPRLVARAVDEQGKPITGMTLRMSFGSGSAWPGLRGLTGSDGSFEILLADKGRKKPIEFQLTETRGQDEIVPVLDARESSVLVPLPFHGPWDAGDLTFVVPPVLVDGVVVDDSGIGVSRAMVDVSYVTVNAKKKPSGHLVEITLASTNERGEFRVRGKSDAERLLVSAVDSECLASSERSIVTPGTRNLRLTLGAKKETTYSGRLECTFTLDPGTPPGTMLAAVQLVGRDPTKPLPIDADKTAYIERSPSGFITVQSVGQDAAKLRPINAAETARFEQLPAGFVSLSVVTRDGKFPVLQLDDLLIPDHGRCDDPRLESIDLRGKIAWTRALLLTPFGEPFTSSEVRIEDDDGHGAEVRTDNEGWFSFPVPSSSKKLAVIAKGYRRAMFEKDDTVKLIVE
jgi:hypothetical protein